MPAIAFLFDFAKLATVEILRLNSESDDHCKKVFLFIYSQLAF